MAELATVGAVFPRYTLGKVAYFADLTGASRYQVVRYLAYLAAGHTPSEAKALAMPQLDMNEFTIDCKRSKAQVDQSVLDNIRLRHPGKDIGWILRYHAALQTPGADENLAIEIADSIKVGRPRKNQSTTSET